MSSQRTVGHREEFRAPVGVRKSPREGIRGPKKRPLDWWMIFYSVGSAIEAIAATAIYARSGWPGISFLGTTFSGVALAIWITPIFSERKSRNSSSLGLLEEERFGRLTAVQTQQQLAARDSRPAFSAKILYGRLAGSGEASISDLM